ncbi:MAG: response regulator receiver protein, partial [Pseudorhodoplanes sp.]
MRMSKEAPTSSRTRVVVLTADPDFAQQIRRTFSSSPQIGLDLVESALSDAADTVDTDGATVIVADLDPQDAEEMRALERLAIRTAGWPPVVVVAQECDAQLARTLIQMKIADFLVKPVSSVDLVRTCARVVKPTPSEDTEAEVYTFIPAVGGAGVTTLAIESAMMLLSKAPRSRTSTCLVDLNLQHGACAEYLDLEPRLDLSEIEP